ncbi:MAG: hypothetical protein JW759_02265 [Candidatus Coatesbacteria bacterium]|nr:hypothetical protein [Candidatus Coatesbacteria bacterium]
MVELDNNKAPLFGRRDAYYDRARALLETGDLDAIFAPMEKNPVNVIYYLKRAFANSERSLMFFLEPSQDELDFLEHIDMLQDESRAGFFAHKHGRLIEQEQSFIKSFYEESLEEIARYLESYMQRARDSVTYLLLHMKLAEHKYEELKRREHEEFVGCMDGDELLCGGELNRYLMAYNSVSQLYHNHTANIPDDL